MIRLFLVVRMNKKNIGLLLIYVLFQPIIIFILSFCYLLNNGKNVESFILSDFVIGVILIFLLLLMIYLMISFKQKERSVNIKIYVLSFLIGGTLSFILNYFMKYSFNIISVNNINIYLYFISSCLLGPIVEEYLFRGLIYHDFLNKYSKKLSILLVTLLFSLIHFNLVSMFFAFVMGILFISLYDKYKNIYVAISCHIGCNIMGFIFLG